MFQKVRHSRVSQSVVNQIQEAIIEGRLEIGQRLPAERELMEMFQTSRGSLREALRVLEHKGLIEIRLGGSGGAVVKDVGTEQLSDSLALLLRTQKVSLDHLAEFRKGVEGHVASLAAMRAQPADIEELRAILTEAEDYCLDASAHRDDFLRADEKFHTVLARISGNPLYLFITQTVHENIHRYYDQYLAMNEAEIKEDYGDLCDMVEAIERREPDECLKIAQDHVQRFNRYMKREENLASQTEKEAE